MSIRIATVNDAPQIKILLDQLGYPTVDGDLENKINLLLHHPDHELIVFNNVSAVMSIHFIPQLALAGDFALISYFAVDETVRSTGIGKKMEEYCVKLATDRGCERIQVKCNIRRTDAHRFYERQGYQEARKYFSKSLK